MRAACLSVKRWLMASLTLATPTLVTVPAWASDDLQIVPEVTKEPEVVKPMPAHAFAVGAGGLYGSIGNYGLHIEYSQDRRWSAAVHIHRGSTVGEVRHSGSQVQFDPDGQLRYTSIGAEGAYYVLGNFDRGAKAGLSLTGVSAPAITTNPAGASSTSGWYGVGDGYVLGAFVGGRFTVPVPFTDDLPFALTADAAAGVGAAYLTDWQVKTDVSKAGDTGLASSGVWSVQPYLRAQIGLAF